MANEVGDHAGGEEPDEGPRLRTIWLVAVGTAVWSIAMVAVGLAISKPYNLTTNAQGAVIATGGTSSLVPFGILCLGVGMLVAQITTRTEPSRFMPVAWALSGALVATSLVAVEAIGPALIPPGMACLAACVLARRRAQGETF